LQQQKPFAAAFILGDCDSLINPPLTPALSRREREPVFGVAAVIVLAIV
jgi:hypothetical protein